MHDTTKRIALKDSQVNKPSMWEKYGKGRKPTIGEAFAYWAWIRSEHPVACKGHEGNAPTFFIAWNLKERT